MAAKKSDEQRGSDKGRRERSEDDNRGDKRPTSKAQRGPAGGPGSGPKPDARSQPDARTGTRKPARGPRPDYDETPGWDGGPDAEDRPVRRPKSRTENRAGGDRPGGDRGKRGQGAPKSSDRAERGPRRGAGERPARGAKSTRRPQPDSDAGDRRAVPPGAEAAVAVGVAAGRKVQTPALTKDGREFLYGRHAVLEMLRAGRRHVHNIWLGEGVQQTGIVADVLSTARLHGIPVKEMSRVGLERLGPVNHQGVVAEVDAYPYVTLDDLLTGELAEDVLFLVLDHLQDVQNLGTLLRTAEVMNVTGVILPERRAAEVTPAAVNASAGAVEHLRIAMVGNLVQALEQLKAAGVWIAGLDSGPGSMPLARADLSGRLALVVGAEGEGLARLAREKCDWLVAIPMYGKIGSLNAAVAGSVALVTARQMQRPRE